MWRMLDNGLWSSNESCGEIISSTAIRPQVSTIVDWSSSLSARIHQYYIDWKIHHQPINQSMKSTKSPSLKMPKLVVVLTSPCYNKAINFLICCSRLRLWAYQLCSENVLILYHLSVNCILGEIIIVYYSHVD